MDIKKSNVIIKLDPKCNYFFYMVKITVVYL